MNRSPCYLPLQLQRLQQTSRSHQIERISEKFMCKDTYRVLSLIYSGKMMNKSVRLSPDDRLSTKFDKIKNRTNYHQ